MDDAYNHLDKLAGEELRAWWEHWAQEFDGESLTNIARNWLERRCAQLKRGSSGRESGRDHIHPTNENITQN